MKSETTPSAPLNLCPPTGVTGTKLEAHSPGCICAACVPPLFSPIPASPVDSVGVPACDIDSLRGTYLPMKGESMAANAILSLCDEVEAFRNRKSECVHCPNCGALAGVSIVSSHAAKDAKIKALEAALQSIAGYAGNLSDENDSVDRGLKLVAMRQIARAAIALPTA